ncbi:QRFP-like peptide receptor isoform X2 [Mya arenaria]|nr:QRFP-like peptide receptor isoform X2 [Mya arenaria]
MDVLTQNETTDFYDYTVGLETLIGSNSSTNYDYQSIFDNLENVEYPVAFKQVPLWEMIVKITLYSVIILSAIVGNILIIVVVANNKRMQSTSNYFIVNLAVSDLLVTGFCTWVRLVDDITEGWVLGNFFCKFNSFTQVMSMVAGIFSLILIACDRFFGIVFAMKAHIIERKASYSIIIIWVCAIAVATPLLVVRKEESVTWSNHVEIWCDDTWPMSLTKDPATGRDIVSFPGRKAYYTFLTIALYFIPMVTMSAIYSLIIMTVWFKRAPGERVSAKEIKVQKRVKRKVVKMLVMILATFGFCWLPLEIVILYSEYRTNRLQPLPEWYGVLEFLAYTLAYANSAINPLIYAGFNENFRKGFRTLFGCYERKLYTAISRADSMYNTSTTNVTTQHMTRM